MSTFKKQHDTLQIQNGGVAGNKKGPNEATLKTQRQDTTNLSMVKLKKTKNKRKTRRRKKTFIKIMNLKYKEDETIYFGK